VTVDTVLSMPDPARDVVRAEQQRALDKLAREQQQRAPAAQPEDPFADGHVPGSDLRSQFSLLQRQPLEKQAQLNQMTLVAERLAHREEQRERGVAPRSVTLDVPPAYDDK
jgi:hypothetical protein